MALGFYVLPRCDPAGRTAGALGGTRPRGWMVQEKADQDKNHAVPHGQRGASPPVVENLSTWAGTQENLSRVGMGLSGPRWI